MKRIVALALLAFAAPALAADSIGKVAMRTVAIGDVTIELAGADGTTVAQVAGNNAAAVGNGIFALIGRVDTAASAYTTGRAAALWLTASGAASVNVAQVLGATHSATNPLFGQLTDGTAVYVGAKTGQLPSALGQTTMAGSVSVALASNQSALAVTSGAPTGSGFNNPAVTNIAAAGSSTIVCKSGLVISQPTKPLQFTVSAPGVVRCQLQFNDNATLTKFASVVTSPGEPTIIWTPPSGIVGLTTSSTLTTLQYEANCTNVDAVAQDVSCAVVYCQAASGC